VIHAREHTYTHARASTHTPTHNLDPKPYAANPNPIPNSLNPEHGYRDQVLDAADLSREADDLFGPDVGSFTVRCVGYWSVLHCVDRKLRV